MWEGEDRKWGKCYRGNEEERSVEIEEMERCMRGGESESGRICSQ